MTHYLPSWHWHWISTDIYVLSLWPRGDPSVPLRDMNVGEASSKQNQDVTPCVFGEKEDSCRECRVVSKVQGQDPDWGLWESQCADRVNKTKAGVEESQRKWRNENTNKLRSMLKVAELVGDKVRIKNHIVWLQSLFYFYFWFCFLTETISEREKWIDSICQGNRKSWTTFLNLSNFKVVQFYFFIMHYNFYFFFSFFKNLFILIGG